MNELQVTTAGGPPAPTLPAYALANRAAAVVESALAGMGPHTRRAYAGDWRAFAAWRSGHAEAPAGLALPLAINGGRGEANLALLEWRQAMAVNGLRASTINRRLSAIRALVKLARLAGVIEWDVEVRGVKSSQSTAAVPSHDDVTGMMSAMSTRDRAIVALIYTLRLRREEVGGLDVEHYALGMVHPTRKGYVDRTSLTVPPEVARLIDEWLVVRGNQPGPLFTTRTGRRMTGCDIYRRVKKFGTTPHRILHRAVTDALAATNGNITDVATWAGHRDINTTRRYEELRHNAQGEIAAVLAKSLTE
jgi:integrase/recombinase XerC